MFAVPKQCTNRFRVMFGTCLKRRLTSVVYTEVLLSARSHCLPAALNNSSVSLNTFKQKLTAYKRDIVGKFAASLDVPTLKTLRFPRWPCSGLKTIKFHLLALPVCHRFCDFGAITKVF